MSLIYASIIGDSDRVRELLATQSGRAELDTVDHYGNTPLYWASSNGHLEVVKYLLRAGADPNITNNTGRTPLSWASYQGYLKIVKELLHAGADPDIARANGGTPLWWASYHGRLEVVKVLLRAGADPNIANRGGRTPLQDASNGKIIEELENYFPSLHTLSLRSLRKFKINISSIPRDLL